MSLTASWYAWRMDWDSVLQSALRGAVIGGIVGLVMAITTMRKRKTVVEAALRDGGWTASEIASSWFHVGATARYRVVAKRDDRTLTTVASVDRKGQVQWEPPLE